MTEGQNCPKCGSSRVIDDVRIVDKTLGEDLKVQVQRNPGAMIRKGTVGVPLVARVCGACGYTELYASDPAKLLEAHESGE